MSRSGRRLRVSRSFRRRCGCGCRLRRLGIAAAVAFAGLAALVATGAATGVDRWAVGHAMPFAGAPGPAPTWADSVVPLLHVSFHPLGHAVAELVTLPGQVVISFVLVAAASRHLWQRGRVEAAVFWLAAWFLAVAVEIVFRHALTRPALYHDGVHIVAFDDSWPSGHTLRVGIAAAALAVAWPRLRPRRGRRTRCS